MKYTIHHTVLVPASEGLVATYVSGDPMPVCGFASVTAYDHRYDAAGKMTVRDAEGKRVAVAMVLDRATGHLHPACDVPGRVFCGITGAS